MKIRIRTNLEVPMGNSYLSFIFRINVIKLLAHNTRFPGNLIMQIKCSELELPLFQLLGSLQVASPTHLFRAVSVPLINCSASSDFIIRLNVILRLISGLKLEIVIVLCHHLLCFVPQLLNCSCRICKSKKLTKTQVRL